MYKTELLHEYYKSKLCILLVFSR